MTEKQLCKNYKHLEHDSGCGIWCGIHGNNRNYDCPKFEYNWGILTKEEAINHLNRLYYENEQLKQTIDEMIKIFNDSGLDYCLSDEMEEILND